MNPRTSRKTIIFNKSFSLEGIGRRLPAGTYEVITDEELIGGLSFPAYRRIATTMLVPGQQAGTVEMVTVDPLELTAALDREASPDGTGAEAAKAR